MRHARHKVVLFGLLQELGSQVVTQMGCDDTRCKVNHGVEKEDGDGKGERDGSCRACTGSVEKVGVRALAAPVSDIRNQLIS